ncbi:fimbrial biogenesis chaperone, partial [Serratia fonticola]
PFYRPKALQVTPTTMLTPWQEKLTLTRQGRQYQVNNPTPYYTTLVDGSSSVNGQPVKNFEPLMLAPFSQGMLKTGSAELGNNPVLTYINDYGARPQLQFTCSGNNCQAQPVKSAR